METNENKYCRFCAEQKSLDKMLNFDIDPNKLGDITKKLNFVNALYVNVNLELLPKTICFVCYESLNKACEFLERVKHAQDILFDIFRKKVTQTENASKPLFPNLTFEELDFLRQDAEVTHREDSKVGVRDVKIELKTENSASDDELDSHDLLAIPLDNNEQSLDVQDILDAAFNSSGTNKAIYAKEVTNFEGLKEISSWEEYPWVCGLCNIEFQDINILRMHSKAVHKVCAAFTCVDCKGFDMKESFGKFARHVRQHQPSLRHQCHLCNKHLSKSDSLSQHVKSHLSESLVCLMCGDILESLQEQLDHEEFKAMKRKRKPRRKRGTPLTIDELTCYICKKVYKNPNSLRDHIKRHTERKRDYTCDRCGKTFYNKGDLKSHIMGHDEIKPYICKICNKKFMFPNMLRRHVTTHSGVKPFACEQCGKTFRLKYQLKNHLIVHTDMMPYGCQYCTKRFRYKQILMSHERQHTGVKPYQCKICWMEFSNWSNYNKHMMRRHGMDTSKKKITPDGVFPVNPETGQIINVEKDDFTKEWESKIMIPAKRGKKKKEDDALQLV